MAAITGLALTRSCGMAVDISWYTLIFSLMARSMRTEADAELVFQQFADGADAAVAEVIDVIDRADALAQFEQVLDGALEVFAESSVRFVESGVQSAAIVQA